jgi:hypothetical protein
MSISKQSKTKEKMKFEDFNPDPEKVINIAITAIMIIFLFVMAMFINDLMAQDKSVRFDRYIAYLEYNEQNQTYKVTLENGDSVELPKSLVVVVENPTPHNPRLIKYVGDKFYYIKTQHDKNKHWTKPTK